MPDNATRLEALAEKWLEGALTSEEQKELEECLNYSVGAEKTRLLQNLSDDELAIQLGEYIQLNQLPVKKHPYSERIKVLGRNSRLKQMLKYAVSAAVVFALAIGVYLWQPANTPKRDLSDASQQERFNNDVPPGSYKAKLRLADGTIILLDTTANGQLAKQGGTVVKNSSGQLVYLSNQSGSAGDAGNMMYNTLSTARAESYATVLSDGSKIWLNAESSIRFPVAFVGRERRIEVTGEVYLEVAHNPKQPFVVDVHGTVVEVLGTHFAINSYANEKVIKTSLLEGKVRVSIKGKEAKVLSPGQQARIEAGSIRVVSDVDVQAEVLWKDGIFSFAGANLAEVLRQLQRWYNVDILYRGMEPTGKYFGRIDRNLPLSVVLKNLEMMTESETFKVEGRAIIVSSKK